MGFAEETAVAARTQTTYAAQLHSGWDIAGNANGGYLLAIAARALLQHTGRPDPITVTAHYLRPGRPGPVSIECRTIKRGRRFSTAGATLTSDGRPLIEVLGTFGTLEKRLPEVERIDGCPPDLPPLETCVSRLPSSGDMAASFARRVDLRLHPADSGFQTGSPTGEARMRGWLRLARDEPIDTVALLLCADALPPTIFNANLPVAWTPTIELTVHVRARPSLGWLRTAFTTRFVSGGFRDEDGELWDSAGQLVAQSRQLALLPLER